MCRRPDFLIYSDPLGKYNSRLFLSKFGHSCPGTPVLPPETPTRCDPSAGGGCSGSGGAADYHVGCCANCPVLRSVRLSLTSRWRRFGWLLRTDRSSSDGVFEQSRPYRTGPRRSPSSAASAGPLIVIVVAMYRYAPIPGSVRSGNDLQESESVCLPDCTASQ